MNEQPSHDSSDWVEVAEVGQLWEAELIVGRLKAEGIDAQIVDQTFHQEPIPNVRSFAVVRVLVPQEQETRAREILAEDAGVTDDEVLETREE